MSRLPVIALSIVGSVAMVVTFSADDAQAVLQFKREFDRKYVDPYSASPTDRALALATREAKCFVCHMDEDKKMHNAYGTALAELLDKDEDKKDRKKIRAALEKVADMRPTPESEDDGPTDDDGPTFGDVIRAGKLPSGYNRVEEH